MMLEFLFLRTRLYTVRSYYYWSEQNETEKPSDEPPTDRDTGLELELTKRTDREEHHLRRLPFVGDHFSVLLHVFIRALIF